MKRMLLILVLGLGSFGASAGVSAYLKHQEVAHADKGASSDKAARDDKGHGGERVVASGDHGGKTSAGDGAKAPAALDPLAPPAVRGANQSADNVVQLAASLRQQQELVRTREQNLLTRQKHLELIYDNLKNERKSQDELRGQIDDELKILAQKLEAFERKATEIGKNTQELSAKKEQLSKTIVEVESVEQKNLKKMATTFDAMDADTAGELLEQMLNGGKMDMAVRILSMMQEGKAARVLAQMQDRGAAVQMLDKMKGLKRPSAAP